MSYLKRLINGNINCLLNRKILIPNSNKKSWIVMTTKLNVYKPGDRRTMINSLPKKDEGSQGEKQMEVDFGGYNRICDFPTLETPNQLFDSIPYKDLPIIHIKTTKNNTIMSLCLSSGSTLITGTAGMEGFKHCRKGTNVAANATAISLSQKAIKMGYKTVRVCIEGLGPGRMSSIKGLHMSGINIVSITDTTPISEYPRARPPVAKSL